MSSRLPAPQKPWTYLPLQMGIAVCSTFPAILHCQFVQTCSQSPVRKPPSVRPLISLVGNLQSLLIELLPEVVGPPPITRFERYSGAASELHHAKAAASRALKISVRSCPRTRAQESVFGYRTCSFRDLRASLSGLPPTRKRKVRLWIFPIRA